MTRVTLGIVLMRNDSMATVYFLYFTGDFEQTLLLPDRFFRRTGDHLFQSALSANKFCWIWYHLEKLI